MYRFIIQSLFLAIFFCLHLTIAQAENRPQHIYADFASIPEPVRNFFDRPLGNPVYREQFIGAVLSSIRQYGGGKQALDQADIDALEKKRTEGSPLSGYGGSINLGELLALDPDKDGKLTVDELEKMARKAFKTVDSDGDGLLSKTEMDAASGPEEKGRQSGKNSGSGCTLKNDARFKDKLRKRYSKYIEFMKNAPTRNNEALFGKEGDDVFYIGGKSTNLSLHGGAGNDTYFLPLMRNSHDIYEDLEAGEENTIVFTDIDRTAPLLFRRTEEDDLTIKTDAENTGGVTIVGWFGDSDSPQKPISCFVFPPDFEILDLSEIEGEKRNVR